MDRRPSYPTTVTTDSASDPILSPHVLDPDYAPQTVHRPDLFFLNSTGHMNQRKNSFSPPAASYTPSPSTSILPGQLYPYHQQAFHNYTPAPSQVYRQIPHPYAQAIPHVPPYDYRSRSATVPTRPSPQPWGPPPQLPPKPIVYPPIEQSTFPLSPPSRPALTIQTPPPRSIPPPAVESALSPDEDSNELAMAMALSQSESLERRLLEEKLAEKEEDDLAKALAASLLSEADAQRRDVYDYDLPGTSASSPRVLTGPSSPVTPPIELAVEKTFSTDLSEPDTTEPHQPDISFLEFGRHDKWRIPVMPGQTSNVAQGKPTTSPSPPPVQSTLEVITNNQASNRRLSVSSASSLPYTMPSPISSSFAASGSGSGNANMEERNANPAQATEDVSQTEAMLDETVLVFDDEAYARQLAAEEEELARQESYSMDEKQKLHATFVQEGTSDHLPRYSYNKLYQSQQPIPAPNFKLYPSEGPSPPIAPLMPSSAKSHAISYPEVYRQNHETPITKSKPEYTSPNPYSSVVYPSLGKRRDTESDAHSTFSYDSSAPSSSAADRQYLRPESEWEVNSLHRSNTSTTRSDDSTGKEHYPATTGMINANHFVDPELLLGVSIGFVPPAISQRLLPMQGPMPNIISLPYSRCPPLHLHAPDWRHLLRLMARLSGTRIEPTIEAVTVAKSELKLRTVVQFVKPNPTSSSWRTILWFSTDVPVPQNVPGASRYTSGNPNLLPWSYTLVTVPRLLGDSMDTNISKTYTIPPLEGVPLPTIPITFPNLALYLQAVLDVSRKHSSDASGIGKLGKIVQMCYPNVEATYSEFDIPEKTTVGHLFKRVIGRSNKDKKKGKATNNEETYQLVTPFVPDEWC